MFDIILQAECVCFEPANLEQIASLYGGLDLVDSNPNLRLDRVFSSSEKVFDPQVLLDPFEIQFYSPSAFVELRNGQCGQVKVIRQEHQSLALFRVSVTDAAEAIRVMLNAFRQTQPDHLITADTRAFVHRARPQTMELQAGFAASDEE